MALPGHRSESLLRLCQQFGNKMQHLIPGKVSNAAHEVQSISLWKLPDRKPQPLTAKSQCLQQSMNEHRCRMCIQSTQWVYPPLWHRSGAEQTHPVLGHPVLQSWGLAKTITASFMLLCPHFLPQQRRGWSQKQIWGISAYTNISAPSLLHKELTAISR